MSDQASNGQLPGAAGGVSDEPSLNNGPPAAVPDIAATPVDDGSDFYNTPLVAGTPVNNAGNVLSSTDNSEPTTPPISAPLIPGLSLFNESLKASQQASGSTSSPEKVNEQSASMRQASEKSAESGHVEPETKDTEMQDPIPAAGDAMETEPPMKQDEATAEPQNNALDVTMSRGEDGMLNRASGAEDAGTSGDPAAGGEEEHPEWEIDSSPYESSSDDTSTDSSDDSDEDDEDYPILSPEEQARILMQAEAGSDDEGKGKSGAAYIKTTNEQPDEVPPVPEITVTPEMKIVLLGNVQTIVENTILIKANISGEYQVLESGSLLCFEDRTVVGVVSETLGRVQEPLYTVRFPTAAAVAEHGISQGKIIYYVESHSTFVFTQPLKGLKGSDASNFHDEEIGEEEMEFSDDEAEAEYKRKVKQERQKRKDAKNEHGGLGRPRKELPGPSRLGQMELNYDDVSGGDGYTPLARPRNLHEMMGNQEAPVEGSEYPGRGSRGGGRGRGGFDRGSGRGRGCRGRGGGSRDSRRSHSSQDDRRQDQDPHRHTSSAYSPPTAGNQSQNHNYSQAPYQQNQQPYYNAPQQYPGYPPYPQQQQQQQSYPQLPVATQFPFQTAYQQPYQQPYQSNPYPQVPPGSHISPALLAALQQHQQMQQQQQQHQQQPASLPQAQVPAATYDQVKAQLDLLRQLSGGAQGPPRST